MFFIIGRTFSQTNNFENSITNTVTSVENYEKVDSRNSLSQKIFGKVLDKKTGETIPYCNIEVMGSQFGTSSNELGEFILEIDSLPVKIIFSHLNYEKKAIEISKTSNLNIQLTPLVNSLNKVVLAVNKKDKYAFELAEKAFSKTRILSDNKKYGRAFYRQKSKNGDDYSEFSEIIYDTNYTVDGIDNWEILEGRYALKREKVNNSNFTLLSRILKSMQPDTDDLIFPLRFNIKEFYDVKVIDILSSQEDEIAVLWFKPLENVRIPILEGEVYVNTKTHEVLKITGTVINDQLNFIKFQEKNAYTKNYQLSYEMAFKKNSKNDMLIDYIKVDHAFDYYKDDTFLTHVTSTSNLMFFEHYDLDKTRRIRNRLWKKGSDWEVLNKIGYNEKFWADNPIVKRTPVEDEVIVSFEKDNAFESIFLNSREQIAFMQSNLKGDVFIKKFDTTIRNYNDNNPVEKVFLHTSKNKFAVGEDLWYKAYVVLGTYHHYSLASKVLHVDLVDANNNIIISQTHKLEEGQGQGHIKLPNNLPVGEYQLRAYTNWMRNFDNDFFFTKKIKLFNRSNSENQVSNNQEKIDLQFFPEGGYAVTGLNGKTTFKAIGGDGLGRKVKGFINNSKGESIVAISSMYQGMGFFSLKPESGEKYTAVLDNGSEYELPIVKDVGYTMFVNNLDSKNIKVKIQASDGLRNKPFYIIGSLNNDKNYQGRFEFNSGSVIDFEIPKSKLPSGVMTLTLFDEHMRPWCERSLFINNKQELIIQTELNKSDFKERDKFELKVHVKDAYGTPLSTNFSLAITDADKIVKNKWDANILTHLLLQSDVKGYIENPAFFFLDDKWSTTAKLDLVMLTHGWRKYNWQEMKDTDFDLRNEFSFKRGYSVSGIANNIKDAPLKNRELKMIAKSGETLNLYTTTTKDDGSFTIENVDKEGSVEIGFNAYKLGGEPIDTKITLLEENDNSHLPIPKFNTSKKYQSDSDTTERSASEIEPFFVNNEAEVLDEVIVKAEREYTNELTKNSVSIYGVEPDHTIINEDKTSGNILYHLGNIPGVAVDLSFNWVNFRGNKFGPLWIVDGMRLEDERDPRYGFGSERDEIADSQSKRLYYDKPKTSNVPLMVQSLDFSNVEKIEVLKRGTQTAIYGPSGKFGVIIVYTKTGKVKASNAFSSKHTIQGYSRLKEFYSPKYDVVLGKHKNADNRTTLYWNPSITTDKNGNATIIFYNSDITKSFDVDIQALSAYGTPGAYLTTYKK